MEYRHATPKVLLVEDDEQSRLALRCILEDEGFDVATAGDGGEGVDMVRWFRPDVILLDLVLPGMNGFDAATVLKKDSSTREIPLIAVTASWLGSDGRRLQKVGFDAALRKPFPAETLVEEVRKVIRP